MEKIKSCFYKLYELRDDMKASLDANDNVVEQEKELVEILKNTETKSDFSEFIKGSEEQQNEYTKRRATLQMRLDFIEGLIKKYEENQANNVVSDLEEIVTWLLLGIGVCGIDTPEESETEAA